MLPLGVNTGVGVGDITAGVKVPLGVNTGARVVDIAAGVKVPLGVTVTVLGLAFVVLDLAFFVLDLAFVVLALVELGVDCAVLGVADVVLLRFTGCFPFPFCCTPFNADVVMTTSSSLELGSLVYKMNRHP